jgi:arginine decarboxylase
MNKDWTIQDSQKLYNIDNWGSGYFTISSNGNLSVKVDEESPAIEIAQVIQEMKLLNVKLPVVIRFHDILRAQVQKLNIAFIDCIKEAHYNGQFQGVYPIKVNQMREVVEEILEAGEEYNYGLEAGSKPELLAVLAYNTNMNALTVLNGYKDEDYLRLALLGTKLGRKIIIVIEKYSELPKLLKLSKEMNITPLIGLRGKMSIKSRGKWAASSGDRAKFGLSTSEIINAVNLMKENNLESSIKLFHFHIGSQISDIKTIKAAINEGSRIYTELHKLGCPVEYFDVGGGLGIDYDGTKSTSDSSVNYSLNEYVSDIVYGLKQTCDIENIPHPNIVTESGRAITAHHSCVVTNVIDEITVNKSSFKIENNHSEHIIIQNIRDLLDKDINEENYQEIFNDARQLKEQGSGAFNLGVISLTERAILETSYWRIMTSVFKFSKNLDAIPESLTNLESELSPQFLCNFSVFQSAADSWAIDQILPVAPITRLNEKPEETCSIADITCDSDGKINNFYSADGKSGIMPIHSIDQSEEYLIGMFLTGAYQDVMGDMHNLFGRLNEVHIYSDKDDPQGFYIEEIIRGNSSSNVLSTMQYNPEYMAQKVKKSMNKLINKGGIAPRQAVKLIGFYEQCLTDYTYLG